MAKFFIDRPIFAWVVALFIIVAGLVAITLLPVAQYPRVAPPTITIDVTYPGASAQTMDESVLSVIEREMNGSPGLAYMESTSQANGTGQISLSFEPGTNADLAQVDVQNRLSRATPRLPSPVVQQGVKVDKASSNFLMGVSLVSEDPSYSIYELGDYVARNVLPEIQRVPGVGQAQLFGASERAMRIWIDPAKLTGFNLSAGDVNTAIAAQNAQVASGTIGDLPNLPSQTISATVVVPGQLNNTEAFGNVVPADLLTQRPDIRAAELQLISANADIGAARAAFFPRISLTGSIGSASSELSGLFKSGSKAWAFLPQITLPIFDAGRNQAGLDLALAGREVAIAQYEKSIQTAFSEVADALAGRQTLGEELRAQRATAEAETVRLRLSHLRYRNGIASALDLLDAQRSLFAVQQAAVQTRLLQLQNQVTLYKTLGGGWTSRQPPA